MGEQSFTVGSRVIANGGGGTWFPGTIAACNEDGSYDIDYDDDDREHAVPQARIRRADQNSPESGQPAENASVEDAPEAASEPKPDISLKLERLAKLRDAGVVTEEEFEQSKKLLITGRHQPPPRPKKAAPVATAATASGSETTSVESSSAESVETPESAYPNPKKILALSYANALAGAWAGGVSYVLMILFLAMFLVIVGVVTLVAIVWQLIMSQVFDQRHKRRWEQGRERNRDRSFFQAVNEDRKAGWGVFDGGMNGMERFFQLLSIPASWLFFPSVWTKQRLGEVNKKLDWYSTAVAFIVAAGTFYLCLVSGGEAPNPDEVMLVSLAVGGACMLLPPVSLMLIPRTPTVDTKLPSAPEASVGHSVGTRTPVQGESPTEGTSSAALSAPTAESTSAMPAPTPQTEEEQSVLQKDVGPAVLRISLAVVGVLLAVGLVIALVKSWSQL